MGRGRSSLRFVPYVFCKHRKSPEMQGLVREILPSADVHRISSWIWTQKTIRDEHWELSDDSILTNANQVRHLREVGELEHLWVHTRQYKGWRAFKVNLNFKIFNWKEKVLRQIPSVCRENCPVDVCSWRKYNQGRFIITEFGWFLF